MRHPLSADFPGHCRHKASRAYSRSAYISDVVEYTDSQGIQLATWPSRNIFNILSIGRYVLLPTFIHISEPPNILRCVTFTHILLMEAVLDDLQCPWDM